MKTTNQIISTTLDVWNASVTKAHDLSASCSEIWSELKQRVTADLTSEFADALEPRMIQRFVNEADSLAAVTEFPVLILPVLAEEKVRAASQWQARQRSIYERSLALAA